MNGYTFGLLKKLDALKNRFITTAGTTLAYMTRGDVVKVMGDTLGMDILINDNMYKNESGAQEKFIPDGYVALIPDGSLGST